MARVAFLDDGLPFNGQTGFTGPIGGAEEAAPRPAAETQVASLPPENQMLPPPLESAIPKARSLMNYVDVVFEVKKEPVPLYQNPGEGQTGVVLPTGTKGKADFEFFIGEERWYQVKTKKGSGWANSKFLSAFSLTPGLNEPVATKTDGPPPPSMDGARKESTYFETAIDDAPLFEKPSEKARHVGTMTPDVLAHIRAAIEKNENILISGGTSTGKTTLLNALSAFLPATDRIVLIEDTAELQIERPNLVRFEARREQAGLPAVTIRELLRATLRHRPDRIIVGEVRGGEAFDLLQALNTGHSGTLSTIHANSAAQALARFSSCVVQSGVELPYQAVRYQIADAINLVLHLGRAHGARVVRELIRISGYDPQRDRYESDVLFSPEVAQEKPMSALVGTSGPLPDETSHNTQRES